MSGKTQWNKWKSRVEKYWNLLDEWKKQWKSRVEQWKSRVELVEKEWKNISENKVQVTQALLRLQIKI